LHALMKLAAAATDPASSPGVRALAAMLADAGGVLPRKSVLSPIAHLEQPDRQALHRLRVRMGPLDVFVDPLLKPAAQYWRAALVAVRTAQPMPALPAAGAATLGSEADARGAALAYRRLGRDWIRIDLADRLASHARKVRSAGGDDPVNAELATSVGLSEQAIGKLMEEVGFTRSGEAWKWRGRRAPRQDRRGTGSHAFAELAKLKKT
jgi:ATP-dependent RNA helicase SUPV3L1/SUV3